MRPEDLIQPISAEAPCGEDLLLADDAEFVDYYFSVEDRFPASYFNLARGTLFDPKTIDAKAEAAQIEPLLKRSRDLRLLGIEAKFQILSGRWKGFVDAVSGMAALLDRYPDEVHPVDQTDRRNAVEELNALATVVAPLEYVVLFTDKRVGDITFRPYGTGSGKVSPREGEEPGNAGTISGAIGSSENAKVVDGLYAQLTGLKDALATMVRVCQAGSGGVPPKLDRIDGKLDDLIAMVLSARPDLAGGAAASEAPAADGTSAAAASTGGAATTITIQTAPGGIADHKVAFRHLQAVERYFVANEPASLALLLVVQARLLVGRPLVEALDALMENNSGYAKINFGGDNGFSISMSRMRDLSYSANIPSTEGWGAEDEDTGYEAYEGPEAPEPEAEVAEDGEDSEDAVSEDEASEGAEPVAEPVRAAPARPAPAKPLEVVSRDHAGLVLKQVEEFFQIREPASPIPVLLFKARNMLSKDFHALTRELIPPDS